MRVDVVIFGGGAAGLWLLDELHRWGYSALLLEASALGQGQTVAAQGIIHGGLKYMLQGWLNRPARQIREMPAVWRSCLSGGRKPHLTRTPLRAEFCHLWHTATVRSRLGMLGARLGLQVAPRRLAPRERPEVLADCPGTVARLDEPVISPAGLLRNLAEHHWSRILRIDPDDGLEFAVADGGCNLPGGPAGPPATSLRAVRLKHPTTGRSVVLQPNLLVFAAGAGNAALRRRAGLAADVMQRRPLHMVLLRGNLPVLNGHCIEGGRPKLTVTTDRDSAGRTVWQVGGHLAETGVHLKPRDLIARARRELRAAIPRLDLSGVEWSTDRLDRAERSMPGRRRPEAEQMVREGNVVTAWPTKLALVPRLAERIAANIEFLPTTSEPLEAAALGDWPRPKVARPPWDADREWAMPDRGPGRPKAA